MAPTMAFMHLCEHAFLDQFQRPCLIGIFDLMTTDKLPLTVRRMCLAGQIIGRPNESVDVVIAITRDDGHALMETRATIDCGATGTRGFIFELLDLILSEYGRYAIGVFLSEDKPLDVTFFQIVRPQAPLPPHGVH
jgi:hypothetical protein